MTRTNIPGRYAAGPQIPPLEAGEQLTRDEFERRYDATPGIRKAELIEGIVHMPPPPVRADYHGTPHAALMGWSSHYWIRTPGTRLADNASIRLDLQNEPQPDAMLLIEAAGAGQAKVGDDGYVEGAPELVVEISGSTRSIDLNAKLRAYRRNGVREYLVWRVRDGAIDWFELREGNYEPLAIQTDGTVRSNVFPGLWLDPAAVLRGELLAMIHVLDKGMASPECEAFRQRLRSAASSNPPSL